MLRAIITGNNHHHIQFAALYLLTSNNTNVFGLFLAMSFYSLCM